MTAGARTFSIEDALLDPPALPPPPLRHALFVSLIALAALLHLTTMGWGDLYNHTEGQYAGAAREMIQTHQWLCPTNDSLPRLPKPPLLYWLIIGSFKIFGISSTAARLPIALAAMASVALTFLIGEKLGDYWRGFFVCSDFFIAKRVCVSAGSFIGDIFRSLSSCLCRGTSRPNGISPDFCSNFSESNGLDTCALFPMSRGAITEFRRFNLFGCTWSGGFRGRL